MPRPTSYPPPASKRSNMMRFTVCDEEQAQIERNARDRGRTIGEFLRLRALGYDPPPLVNHPLSFKNNPFIERSMS